MKITHHFCTHDPSLRISKQQLLHRRCILKVERYRQQFCLSAAAKTSA